MRNNKDKRKQVATGKLKSWREFLPQDMPYFAPQECIRQPGQTDEQWAWELAFSKVKARRYSVMLVVFQVVATAFGYHKTCLKAECRRKGCCMGRRDLWRNDDGYARTLFPLCGTIEMAERVIEGVKAMLGIMGEKRIPMFAPDGSLHRGAEVLEDET